MSGILFEQYHERLRRLRASASAQKNHARTYAFFMESGLDSETVTDVELEEWLLGLPVGERTRVLHFQNVSAVYRYAQRTRRRDDNPVEYVRLPRPVDKEPRTVPVAELRRIRDRCITEAQVLMFHLLAYTGMRRTEARTLTWNDVTPDLLTVIGKGGKLRYIPVHPALGEVLADARRPGHALIPGPHGDALTDGGFDARFKQIAPGWAPHDFRRTVANELYDAEVTERVIDEIMGWAPRKTGHKFYRGSAQAHAAILSLYRRDPI